MIRKQLEDFLKNNGFLSLNKWRSFEIEHSGKPPANRKEQQEIYRLVKDNVLNKCGLYVYTKNKKILYIGKGKPLFNRIKDHYWLSYKELSGDNKNKTWHKFFSSHLGRLKVYWKELEGEEERIIFEKILIYLLKPEFEIFQRKNKS